MVGRWRSHPCPAPTHRYKSPLGDASLAQGYRELLLGSAALTVEPVSPAIAEEAARLRATHGLRTPDAVQLATARLAGAQSFLTNDADLAGIPGLEVIVPDQLLADE